MTHVKSGKCCGLYFRMYSNRFQALRRPFHSNHYLWPNLISPLSIGQEFFSTTINRKPSSRGNYRFASLPSPFLQRRGDQGNTSNWDKCDKGGGSPNDYDKDKDTIVRPYSASLPSPGYEWCKRCNIPDKRHQKKIGVANRCLDRPRIFGLGICNGAKQYYRQQFYILVFAGIFCFGGICAI
mmetsp:Transcript_20027/g.55700  ORF Transcript_20027/g.55700 Transcript_20027/m.55700 type:complete len:182 (+) Transcript_20027:205-750(+)